MVINNPLSRRNHPPIQSKIVMQLHKTLIFWNLLSFVQTPNFRRLKHTESATLILYITRIYMKGNGTEIGKMCSFPSFSYSRNVRRHFA
jgi:hypothetical protein